MHGGAVAPVHGGDAVLVHGGDVALWQQSGMFGCSGGGGSRSVIWDNNKGVFPGLSNDGIVPDIIGGASDITLWQQQRLVLRVSAVILEASSSQVAVWMKPISINRGTRYHESPKFTKPISVKLKGGGCPIGTVPIRRLTKEDLIRERLASRIMPLEYYTPGAHNVVLPTRADSNKKFLGAGAALSLHNPHVDGRQYSAAKVKILNGPDSIEAGLDNLTVFNTRCPGFILVRPDETLDLIYHNFSVPGGQSFYMQTYIARGCSKTEIQSTVQILNEEDDKAELENEVEIVEEVAEQMWKPKRSAIVALALSTSISSDGVINRNKIILDEAQAIWTCNKIMGLGYDGEKDEVITKFAAMEAQDLDRADKAAGKA
ncbi:hypothetical protein RHMOL_Rhmol11G0078400 [Rhododendron molle]|uniref:Uncharacterized protein n=1 Tax=Rhododendron molle TaxID=49168 RepID=A0ACC0LPP6_RHOML|nr:hypothetical protein RHMOL_Rhmol11G0078400 [Rhododendron molle]